MMSYRVLALNFLAWLSMRKVLRFTFFTLIFVTNSYADPVRNYEGMGYKQYYQDECGPITRLGQYGPFDYRTATQEQKELVESAHYEPGLLGLNSGKLVNERGFVWNEFDYTLRAFPNHHGALNTIDRFAMGQKSDKPPRAARSAHCYFLKAIAFQPDDGLVRMLYGNYLVRRNELEQAIYQYQRSEKLGPQSSDLFYNLGLAYYKLKDYAKSREYARKAYSMGYPLPGLKNMLKRVGQW